MAQSSARILVKKASAAFKQGRARETVDYCRQALQLSPNNGKALSIIGTVYHAAGDFIQAEQFYRQATVAEPQDFEHLVRLSQALTVQGKSEEAFTLAKRAAAMEPKRPEGHAAVARMLLRHNSSHVAQQYLEGISELTHSNLELWCCYCSSLKTNEETARAAEEYAALLKAYRVPLSFRVSYETHIPRLLLSREAIAEARNALVGSIKRFATEKEPLHTYKLTYPLFYLAFHNEDNRAIAVQFHEMMRKLEPRLNYTAPHAAQKPVYDAQRPIVIGFCSRYMHDHSVGRCYRGALMHLHRDPRFKVILFTHNLIVDDAIRQLHHEGVEIVQLPLHIVPAQKAIADRALDILVYPEIGMNTMTYCLAMAKLAPYQCVLTGHPDTTGLETMDYFISSRLYEPPNAQENYSEQLLTVPVIDSVFNRPSVPAWLSRAQLGLPKDKKLYVCPMAIQKMHPDYDDILADILARDPSGVIVLFNDFMLKSASEKLQQRILAKCAADRVIFLPWQSLERLFSILKSADAVLATIYFGAGTTGQYCAALGIPMVNLPGRFARSRMVDGFYKLMGITDPPTASSPQEYAEMAVRLANDKAYYEEVSSQLLAKNHLLLEDNGYGAVFAQLMVDIMQQKLDSYALPPA